MIVSPLLLTLQTHAPVLPMGVLGYQSETSPPSFEGTSFSSNALQDQANQLGSVVDGKKKGAFMNVNFHFDNDAHVDDLVAFVLLQTALGDRLRSVTVSHGDSIMMSALETYQRLFGILGREDIKLGAGQRDIRNHFPTAWRDISEEVNRIELIAKATFSSQSKGQKSSEVLREAVQQGPLCLITTGALTNIAEWFRQYPQDVSSVHSLVMMGGALDVAGNVDMSELSDGTAEWNFFADPEAAETVLKSGIPITLIPLDVAGQIPVSDDFLSMLSRSKTVHGQLAYQLWNLVYRRYNYFLWDVVAAIAAIHPEPFIFEEHKLSVVQDGRAQGRIVETVDGSPCQVAMKMNTTEVLNKVIELLNKS